ncbi:hypothetical protein [Chlamydia vaughanii]|uniref:hypothetical protein n=1 Tax=Chlamydia vaughanii TaxID=3112552 RepID=UPI0032B0FDD4
MVSCQPRYPLEDEKQICSNGYLCFLPYQVSVRIAMVISTVIALLLMLLGSLNPVASQSFVLLFSGFLILSLLFVSVLLLVFDKVTPQEITVKEIILQPIKIGEPILEVEEEQGYSFKVKSPFPLIVPPTPPSALVIKDSVDLELPQVAQEALEEAKTLLKRKKFSITAQKWPSLNPPINQEISFYSSLLKQTREEMRRFLKVDGMHSFHYPQDSIQTRFNNFATEYMQLAFSLSYLTLLDLPAYLQAYPETNLEAVLTYNDSPHAETFYAVPIAYRFLRDLHINCVECFDEEFVESRMASFEKQGEVECLWKELFITFCDQVRAYTDNEEALGLFRNE